LQKIRNDLTAAARSASNRGDAHRIYELVDAIDDSIHFVPVVCVVKYLYHFVKKQAPDDIVASLIGAGVG
jgi:hypothetical protein